MRLFCLDRVVVQTKITCYRRVYNILNMITLTRNYPAVTGRFIGTHLRLISINVPTPNERLVTDDREELFQAVGHTKWPASILIVKSIQRT